MFFLTAQAIISISLVLALTVQVSCVSETLKSSLTEQQQHQEESSKVRKLSDAQEIIQVESVRTRQLRVRPIQPTYISSGSPPGGAMFAVNGTNGTVPENDNGTYGTSPTNNGTIGTMADVTPFRVSATYPNTIVSWMNGKCIDAGLKQTNSQLQMYSCYGWNSGSWYGNQIFQASYTYSWALRLPTTNNLCFDVWGGESAMKPGAAVGLWPCVQGAVNQQWNYSPWAELRAGPPGSKYNYLCLDIQDENRNDGAKLVLWNCNGNWNQKWSANNFGWFSRAWDNNGGFPRSGSVNYGPTGANFGALFDGWTDISKMNYPKFDSNFWGTKFITVGGSAGVNPPQNDPGYWNVARINNLMGQLDSVKNNGNLGIGIDIELGDSGLASKFIQLFSAAKGKGLQVFVTISHDAPYGIGDKCYLTSEILKNNQVIDFIVPQLYSASDAFEEYASCGWGNWKTTQIPVVPVVWRKGYVDNGNLSRWANNNGIKLSGYMLWTNY